MAGKRELGWAGLGTMMFLGCFILHGCFTEPCGCSPVHEEIVMRVHDGNGPVDSALITVYRADSLVRIDSSVHVWGRSDGPGAYAVFTSNDTHHFPPGSSTLAIRVIARKGGKSGEETLTLRINPDGMNLRKTAGADTIRIR